MMQLSDDFFDRRAESLCVVHLTRRDDLRVLRVRPRLSDGDSLVEISQTGEWTGRVFGVRVKGLKEAVSSADEVPLRLGRFPLADMSSSTFPCCAIVFTSDDEQGYVRWVLEPVRAHAGGRLKTVRKPVWRLLNADAIDEIVAAVNAWYEAQRQPPAA